MKQFLQSFKNGIQKNRLVILIVIVLLGAFYWFEIKPSIIHNKCHHQAVDQAKSAYSIGSDKFERDVYDFYYKMCLRNKGL